MGATLYQAAAGEPPFTGTPIEVASQHVSKPPPPLARREAGLDVGEGMEDLILACLSKNEDERPSAEEAQERFADLAPTAAIIPPEPETDVPRETRRERPEPTVASSAGRTQRRGRIGALLPLLAILAVLAVVGAFAIPGLIGGGDTARQNNPQNGQQAAAGGQNNEGGNQGGSGSAAGNTPQPTTPTAEQTPAPESEQEPDGQQAQNESPEQAAEQTVNDFYASAADGDYQRSSQLLTPGYRQSTWPSRSDFAGTFGTLQSVQFVDGPRARVEGDTATVTFSTVARHTNRVDRPDGTATLVRQGDDWRIDDLAVG